jgi:FHA domain
MTVSPATFVVEANLSNLVGEIRAALGDSARGARIIRTLHGFGYAFTADARTVQVEPASKPASCWLLREWDRFALSAGENIIGRAEDAHVRRDAAGVSRRHARIFVAADSASIEDLGSKNGTVVRGERVTTRRELVDGDEVTVGSVRVQFRRTSPTLATTATVTAIPERPEQTPSKTGS